MRFDGVRLGNKCLCASLLEVVPWQMSLCKCQFIKAVPISWVLDTCLTHQLPLKVVPSYPMQDCDEKCVQIDRFVLWLSPLWGSPPIHMQSWRDVPRTLQLTGFCPIYPHGSWKKPNSFTQILFHTSRITLENNLWHQQVTEVLNKPRSAAKVEMREEGISQQVFEKMYQKKDGTCRNVPWAHLHFRHSPGSVITAMRLFFRMYSLYLDIALCLGKWNWSILKKISFIFSVVPDGDTTQELYLEKVSLSDDTIIVGTYVLCWCVF